MSIITSERTVIRAVSLREQCNYLNTIVDIYKLEVMVIALSDRLNLEKKISQ